MKTKQKIIPHLWFDSEAIDAAEFYTSAFGNGSTIKNISVIHDTPSGDCDIVSFELLGHTFMSISAGPLFRFNPSVSFMVNFYPSKDKNARKNLNLLWEKLAEGGKVLMPLDKYPFSEQYGWVEDQYGLSWQLILSDPEVKEGPSIVPSLMFTDEVCGKAEEAFNYYLSVFRNTKEGMIARYGKGQEPNKEGSVMFADFAIEYQWFAVMDSAQEHNFAFNEAVSFMVNCDTQDDIDYYWDKLSAVPEAEQCGWLKDRFGVSWQVVPTAQEDMMSKGSPEQIKRVTQAFFKMKKFDIKELEKAYNND